MKKKSKKMPGWLVGLAFILLSTAGWAFYSLVNNSFELLLSNLGVKNVMWQNAIVFISIVLLIGLVFYLFGKKNGLKVALKKSLS